MCTRCGWANAVDPLYTRYHDEEWGVPRYDDRVLFEMLILEGAQAGLSWITILKKRARYREVFDRFDAKKMVCYDEPKIAALMADPGIVRNRLKIKAAILNARGFLEIQEHPGGFGDYIWQFVDGTPITNSWPRLSDVPASTPESDAMSRDLKKRGFKFVGPTICYAFMQAVGMVNDHTTDCFRYAEISRAVRCI